ncbi:hypothetical protein MSAN_01697300 [Mycena sanguinolenta]|uniref:T6SS Phospholipase effector Tle1-like catalytic domain-containing protein n=1 Tax=Mycena sanguinolenta TaxID=230812 RepID=A0A8H7CTI9_9AGAR|nr:hypothetical protein MSAN_01697300 [Mycena sanguinolenta]
MTIKSTRPILPSHRILTRGLLLLARQPRRVRSSLLQETPLPPSTVSQTAKGCPCSKSGRRLIVAFDGTENQFGWRSSHVVEFYSRIVKNDDQPSYYTSGIGTYTKSSAVLKNAWVTLKNKWASVTGSNFKSNLLAGYQWLSENYEEGDRIFLLGFSRGAYQASVGLIRTGNKEQIPFAFEIYRDSDPSGDLRQGSFKFHVSTSVNEYFSDGTVQPDSASSGLAASAPETGSDTKSVTGSDLKQDDLRYRQFIKPKDPRYRRITKPEEFKKAFCHHVNIHFVGVWDTVSSVGIFRNKYYPGAQSAENICFFRHALALDERRVKFLPEYVVAPHLDWFKRGSYGEPRCKEVWFRGCHSDVGGGRRTNLTSDNGSVPSRWMAHQAMLAGLEMSPFRRTFVEEDFTGLRPTSSMTWFYKFFEYVPLGIAWADDSKPPSATPSLIYSPHRARPRQVHCHQKIHLSVGLLGYVDETSLAHLPSAWGGWNEVLWKKITYQKTDDASPSNYSMVRRKELRMLRRAHRLQQLRRFQVLSRLKPPDQLQQPDVFELDIVDYPCLSAWIECARKGQKGWNTIEFLERLNLILHSDEGNTRLVYDEPGFKQTLLNVLDPSGNPASLGPKETAEMRSKRIEFALRIASKLPFEAEDVEYYAKVWGAVWRLLAGTVMCGCLDRALVIGVRHVPYEVSSRKMVGDFLRSLPERDDDYLNSLGLGSTADAAKAEVIIEVIAADHVLDVSQYDSSRAIYRVADDANREKYRLKKIPSRVLRVLARRLDTAGKSYFGDCFAEQEELARKILSVIFNHDKTTKNPALEFVKALLRNGHRDRILLNTNNIFGMLMESDDGRVSQREQFFLGEVIQKQPALAQDYCLQSTRFSPIAEGMMIALQHKPEDVDLLKILVPLTPYLPLTAQVQTEELCNHLIRRLGGDGDPQPKRTAALCLVVLYESDPSGHVASLLKLNRGDLATRFRSLGYQAVWEAVRPRITENSTSTPTKTARQQVCNAIRGFPEDETWAVSWALELIPALPVEGITDERRVHHEDGGMSDAPVEDLEGEQHERNREGDRKDKHTNCRTTECTV